MKTIEKIEMGAVMEALNKLLANDTHGDMRADFRQLMDN